MKNTKRVLALGLSLALALGALALTGCGGNQQGEGASNQAGQVASEHTFTDDRIEYQAGFLSTDGLTESIAQKADRKSKRKTKKKGAELHDHSFIAQGAEAREEES